MKIILHSTILYGLLAFAVGVRTAPIGPQSKSVSLSLSSRALVSDEEAHGHADDLSYRPSPLGSVPTTAEQPPPHPRHIQTPTNHLEARGIKAFFKKIWKTVKHVATNAFGTVKDVIKTFKTHGAKAFFKQAFNTFKGVVGKNLRTVKEAASVLHNRGLADKTRR